MGPFHSRTRVLALFVALFALATVVPGAIASDDEAAPELYPMIFPVVGEHHYSDTWGACRGSECSRSHEGVDIMADKMAPVVAVAAGTVGWMHDEAGGKCCAMGLYHDDGWASWYIHLNNDTEGTDDGLGWGFAEGITHGVHVEAGQLIGWVGDSGNAEETAPHVHFELHQPGVGPINPTPHVDAAIHIDEAYSPWEGSFRDDDESVHRHDIERMALLGVTKGCNPPFNTEYCPERHVTRGEMAAFLRRLLELPAAPDADHYLDDEGSVFEGDIDALAEAGIAFGCTATDYCPDADLLRNEMAELLARAFELTNPDGLDFFADDEDDPHAAAINALKYHGITKGCDPPDNTRFCPERPLTRAEMATFIVRAIDDQAAAEAEAAGIEDPAPGDDRPPGDEAPPPEDGAPPPGPGDEAPPPDDDGAPPPDESNGDGGLAGKFDEHPHGGPPGQRH